MCAITRHTDPRDGAANRLAAAIRQRHRNLLRELRIDVVEGGVVLHGFAYSFYGKQVAQHETLRRLNLVLLANRIVVEGRAAGVR